MRNSQNTEDSILKNLENIKNERKTIWSGSNRHEIFKKNLKIAFTITTIKSKTTKTISNETKIPTKNNLYLICVCCLLSCLSVCSRTLLLLVYAYVIKKAFKSKLFRCVLHIFTSSSFCSFTRKISKKEKSMLGN